MFRSLSFFPARLWIIALSGAALLAVPAYWPILNNGFVVWDDFKFIVENPHIHGLDPDRVGWMLTSMELEYWHPVPWLGFAVIYYFFGLEAGAFHAFSLFLHILNSLWVGLLSGLLFNLHARRGVLAFEPRSRAVVVIATALFAVHPQHVEVVAWASELKELFCEFYYFPAVIAYLLYCQAGARGARYWYALSVLLFALALNAKPMAVSLPVVLLVLDGYPLRRWQAGSTRRLLQEKIPFFLLALGIALLTIWEQHTIGTMSDTTAVALLARILNASHSTLMYLWQWLVPLNFNPFYPYGDNYLMHHWSAWWPLAGVVLLSLAALRYAKPTPYVPAAWLAYLLLLAPVAGVVQVGAQAAADRYAYLSTVPVYVLGSALLVSAYDWLHRRGKHFLARSGGLVFGLVLVVLILLSARQSLIWRTNLGFWEYAAEHAPRHPIPIGNLGAAYMAVGRFAEAVPLFEALVNSPNQEDPGDYYNLASAYMRLERYAEAGRIYEVMLARQMDVGERSTYVYANLAWIYQRQGASEPAQELAYRALQLNPDNRKAREILDIIGK